MRKQTNGAIERCVRRLTVDIVAVVKRAVREQVLEALRAARADTEAPRSARPTRGGSKGAGSKTRRGIQKPKNARGPKAKGPKAEAAKKKTGQGGKAGRARGAERARGRSTQSRGRGRTRDTSIVEVAETLGGGVVLKWPRKRRGRRSNGVSRRANRNGNARPNGPATPLLDGALFENGATEGGASAEHPAPTPLFVHRRKRDGTIQPIERGEGADQAPGESLE